jgi:hypothetical protein
VWRAPATDTEKSNPMHMLRRIGEAVAQIGTSLRTLARGSAGLGPMCLAPARSELRCDLDVLEFPKLPKVRGYGVGQLTAGEAHSCPGSSCRTAAKSLERRLGTSDGSAEDAAQSGGLPQTRGA